MLSGRARAKTQGMTQTGTEKTDPGICSPAWKPPAEAHRVQPRPQLDITVTFTQLTLLPPYTRRANITGVTEL